MSRKSLKEVLMEQHGFSSSEADEEIQDAINEAMELLEDGDMEAAHEICETRWGLEPDYLEDFLI